MNNIGFAATKNTAVATNNNAASSTANLNSLATAFGGASSSAGGGLNSLILGLFIQIIQTLLKNMQNKPCCDQNNKPQTLPLEKLDTKKLLNALGDSGSSNEGNTSIDSIEDSDKSGELSVGDKINLKTVTRDPQTGADTVKYSAVKLTQEQLDRYQSTSTPNTLTLTAQQLANLNSNDTMSSVNFDPATETVIDTDNNGKLSTGDLLSGTYIPEYSDGISQGEAAAWSHTLSEGDVKVLNGEYGSILAKSNNEADRTLLMKTGDVLGLDLDHSVKNIFDQDGSNTINEGDIATIVLDFSTAAVSGEQPPRFPEQYIKLTNDDINKINENTVTPPDSRITLAASDALKLQQALSLDDVETYTRKAGITEILDNDGNGQLSIGDTVNTKTRYGTESDGSPFYKTTSETLTQNQLDIFNKLGSSPTLTETQKANLLLDVNAGSTFEYLENPTILDNDSNGKLSDGDKLFGFYTPYPEYESAATYNNFWSATINADAAKAINGEYGKPLEDYELMDGNVPKRLALEAAIDLDPAEYRTLGHVLDKDNSGDLSVGDIAVYDAVGATAAISNPPPSLPFGPYVEITDTILQNANSQTENILELTDAEAAKLVATLEPDYQYPSINAVKDNDKSGTLSAADTVYLRSIETDTNGPELNSTLTKSALSISQSQVDRFQSSEAINTLQLSDAQKQALDEATSPIGAQGPGGNLPKVSSVIDTDKNGTLSVGDIVNKRASAETAEAIFGDYYTYESYASASLTQEQLDAVNQS
jgi:hypothetical protein